MATSTATAGLGNLGNLFGAFAATAIIFWYIFMIIFYIYFSLTLMLTAKRLGVKNSWLAWIPIINMYLYPKMAKKQTWPLVFVYVPFILNFFITENTSLILSLPILLIGLTGAVFSLYWFINILKRRGKPWWWVLLLLIPIFNVIWAFIMWGILAWGKGEKKDKNASPPTEKINSPDMRLVHYLRKYHREGYPISHLREHLINEGEEPLEIDRAIRHM